MGLYGLLGAGRTELLNAVYGSWPGRVDGEVVVNGALYEHRAPRRSIARGMALLTEDRKATGNLQGQDLMVNLSAASLDSVARFGLIEVMPVQVRVVGFSLAYSLATALFGGLTPLISTWLIDRLAETRRGHELLRRLNVQPPDLTRPIEGLSGGNQQKVLLGRALATTPELLLLDEPTLGVDIGSRFQMYEYIRELAQNGMAILLVSSDIEEVHHECDRILVMYKGRITGEFDPRCERRDLLAAATGGVEE